MSGKPNMEGVKQLRQAFDDFASERRTISELEVQMARRAVDLSSHRDALRQNLEKIKSLMAEMDVASPGNAGWEGRHFELLLMLSLVR